MAGVYVVEIVQKNNLLLPILLFFIGIIGAALCADSIRSNFWSFVFCIFMAICGVIYLLSAAVSESVQRVYVDEYVTVGDFLSHYTIVDVAEDNRTFYVKERSKDNEGLVDFTGSTEVSAQNE